MKLPKSLVFFAAHGKTTPRTASDKDVALATDERRKQRERGLQ